jgi:hypothetical protein
MHQLFTHDPILFKFFPHNRMRTGSARRANQEQCGFCRLQASLAAMRGMASEYMPRVRAAAREAPLLTSELALMVTEKSCVGCKEGKWGSPQ